MHAKRVLFFLLLFAFTFNAYPAIFVVTSNADSGPGTLRDALTQAAANGSAVKDYINFNLPDLSAAGRTITITTDLPVVSSNLVIDGSTQPGTKFGVSDAKVAIVAVYNTNHAVTCCFNLSYQQDIEIYGFLMDSSNLSRATANAISGIYGAAANNIIIGAPGKGNITKNLFGIIFLPNSDEANLKVSDNIKVSSNLLGLNEDGETLSSLTEVSLRAKIVRNLTLGGATPAEGNIFVGQVDLDEVISDLNANRNSGSFVISNNFFGVDISGTKPIPNLTSGSALLISGSNIKQILISQNLFVAQTDIGLSEINCFFKITGNKFGTDITGSKVLGTSQFSIGLGYCHNGGIIGGMNVNDQNIFAGAYQGGPDFGSSGVVSNTGSPNVEVVGNSFRCNYSTYPYQVNGFVGKSKYYVSIATRSTNSISGTATPNSRVDLYYSLTCDHCEPEKQFTSVNTDVNGKWIFNGSLLNYNVIAASTTNGETSEFTSLRFTNQPTDVKIKMACGSKNGSITGIKTNNLAKYNWYDSNGKIVANTEDLVDAAPGKYYLVISDGYCNASSPIYEIDDAANQIDATNEKVTFAFCNQYNGSIAGIKINPLSSIIWTDDSGNIISHTYNLRNVKAGNYTLTATTADGSCSQILGPITVKNGTGPNIDQSKVAIQPTNCGQSTGSITNLVITGTGTLKYSWLNDQQQQVATSANLTNQPAGTYKLQVTDDTQCGPIFSSDFEIPELNGITLDESNVQIVIASCSINNGSVTGIKVDGATQYQWLDTNNKVMATTPDLQNAAAGDYTLTASNSYGCTETSKPYHIGQQLPTQFPVYTNVIVSSCFDDQNGSISVTTDALVKSLRWQNSQGQTISTAAELTGVPTGVYQLYLTDQNGCESLYGSFTVPELARFTVAQAGLVTNDQCGLKTGSVTATTVSGGLPPYTYKWVDAGGVQVGSESSITNLPKGSYTLNIIDSKCGNIDIDYTINEQTEDITAPTVNNAQLCSSGTVVLTVTNPVTSSNYRLYDSQTSTKPLDEQPGGNFTVNVNNSRSYFISQLTGTCESSRTEVKVTVGISALNIINTFTPNGDGINDYWKITGIENYPDATVRVFNRFGQKEFDSKGYAVPFDGKYGGKLLPPGVYYYIINLSNKCNMLSGSLTIIR